MENKILDNKPFPTRPSSRMKERNIEQGISNIEFRTGSPIIIHHSLIDIRYCWYKNSGSFIRFILRSVIFSPILRSRHPASRAKSAEAVAVCWPAKAKDPVEAAPPFLSSINLKTSKFMLSWIDTPLAPLKGRRAQGFHRLHIVG